MDMFVKVYAAPGIDSHTAEQGVFNSGAGRAPETPTLKTPPYDWFNEAPTQSYATENLVGNFVATKAPPANALQIRKRGLSPFGGFFPGKRQALAYQHPGGIADMNPGASHLIAGGPGQASSFCRVNGNNAASNRRMKLPVLPQTAIRGGAGKFPTGGGSHEPLVAPMQPRIQGWPTIFSFTAKPVGA